MKRVKRTLRFSRLWASTLFASLLGLANPGHVHSAGLPMGGQIVSGTGQIGSANAQALTVTQSSPKMIVDWASFNVGAGSTVTFVQPGSSSVALNRVTGPDPSTIQGSIRANGQVFLVNPNGVYFTPGSQISVGALVASTLKISNEDFNSGRYRFEGNSTAQLINEGSITATGDGTNSGAAYFIAARVINRGSIDAPHGKVGLASGRKVMLDIGAPVPLQIDESAIDGLIEQSGIIKADGGQIMITSKAASALHASVINQTGTLQATSLGIGQNGEIILSAGENGTANISGTLNVSSPDNQAGRVEVTAQKITIKDGARIDATGQTGGGTVLIGGDWQGSGATQQAKTVSVEPDVEIDASAKSLGDGGKVVVWSDIRDPESITSVSGSLKSEGGSIQGNGGMIETSGHALQVDGVRISTQAQNGKTGLWLLDPYDVTINSTGTTGNAGSQPNFNASGNSSTVRISDLESALSTSAVTVTTGSAGGETGRITVENSISSNSANLLTLNAAEFVELESGVSISRSGSGGLAIVGQGLMGSGNIVLGSATTSLTVNQSGTSTYSGVISGAGGLVKQGAGTLTLSGNSTFSGGTLVSLGSVRMSSRTALGTGTVTLNEASTAGDVSVTTTYYSTLSQPSASTAVNNDPYHIANDFVIAAKISGATYLGTESIINGVNGVISSPTGAYPTAFEGNLAVNTPLTIYSRNRDRTTFNGVISGSGDITIANGDRVTFTRPTGIAGYTTKGANTFTGALRLSDSGTMLQVDVNDGLPSTTKVTLNAGTTLRVRGTAYTLAGLSGSGTYEPHTQSQSLTLNIASSEAYEFSGIIGSGEHLSLSKTGSGVQTLSGANTYTGTTSINAGTLIAANNTALGATAGSTTVSNGATLSLPGGITTAEPITLNGAGVSNAGSLRNISGTNTVSGAITLATDSSVGIDSSTAALTLSGIIGESGGTRALTKLGDGTLTLSGANTYTGTTSINAGTLIASHATALGSTLGSTIVADGATLQLADGLSLAAESLVLNGEGVSTVGSLVLENNNYSGTITLGTDSVRIGVNGSGISTLGAISGNNKTLVIHQSGNSTLAQSAAANLDQLAFTGSTGIVQFTNPGNSIGILAADTGQIEFVNGSSLTIGTVNPTGITATGPVSISTETGDLFVNASITTTDASAQAIVLNSGRSASAGSATGGDIIFTPGVALSKGANGRALLYTGGISTSSITPSGVTFILGDSRFNADETTQNFRPIDITILNTPRTFAIYREQPIITVQADDKSKIFDYIAFPAAQLTATCTGCANGDLPTITYTGSAGSGSAVYIGSYPITATYYATNLEALGYTINNIRSSGSVYDVTAATLSIVPFPGYIPPPRETVERTSQIPIRYLIENMQPTQLKIVLADHPSLVSLFSPTLAKGNIRLAYQDGTAYREDIRLREGIVRDTIFFDAGKPSLSNEATRTLDSLLRTANRYNLSAVEVVGHTELPNSPEDALKLSEERAKVVSEYLQNRWSLDKRPAKITSLGRSYLQPISDNITYSGRARNRRTEVTITGISLE